MYKIEKGIPVEADDYSKEEKQVYPFSAMSIGDSFFVHDRPKLQIWGAVYHRQAKYGENYVCLSTKGGTRVWRVN